MEIVKNTNGNELEIAVSGRLDTTTAPKFEAEIKASIAGVTNLVINMTDLAYVSSAGLRVLLSAQKKMNQQGSMVVKGVNEVIMEIFEVTGFSDFLTIQ